MLAQSNNQVSGDLAGRDIVRIHNEISAIETWMSRLRQKFEAEKAAHTEFRSVIETLQFYNDLQDEEPLGLEKKLELAGRQADIGTALREKESFVKCMTRHSLSEVAQTVLAYCLGEVTQLFTAHVKPLILKGAPPSEVDTAVIESVVHPVIRQLEMNFLDLMPHEIRGMVYYLTANCFLTWHAQE